jgi:predicted secreted protein
MRLKCILMLTLMALPVLLFSGDLARFINLGFSNDSRYFMFGSYGINEKTSLPYAELYIVDVPSNSFVPNGRIGRDYATNVEPGNDGLGAMFNLYRENQSLISSYGINHLITGRILYLLVDGDIPKDQLDFRDFVSKKRYLINLIQSAWGSGKDVQSSFYIEMTVFNADNTSRQSQLGLPFFKRRGVRNYKIKEAVLAPDSKSLVFVIEKAEEDTNGVNIRYMVETIRGNF